MYILLAYRPANPDGSGIERDWGRCTSKPELRKCAEDFTAKGYKVAAYSGGEKMYGWQKKDARAVGARAPRSSTL